MAILRGCGGNCACHQKFEEEENFWDLSQEEKAAITRKRIHDIGIALFLKEVGSLAA